MVGEEPHAQILCYPKPSKKEINKRLRQLRKLGIDALEFTGAKRIMNVPVLGKGYVGVVVAVYRNMDKFALKIRRVDADRCKMTQEATLLEMANSVAVGPKYVDQSRDFLLMQFIDGELLPEWLEKKTSRSRIRKVLRLILEQCWRLDMIGLDHGELSHAPKHVLVDKKDKVFIVDFETASTKRKSSNVTSICQFLFISSLAKRVAEKLGKGNRSEIVKALKLYKKGRNRENFQRVLEACGV